MNRKAYDLWRNYHLGLIDRELTKEEKSEVEASDFAMHLLLPSQQIWSIICKFGGYENVLSSELIVDLIARTFVVSKDVVIFKINDLIKDENSTCKKIVKK